MSAPSATGNLPDVEQGANSAPSEADGGGGTQADTAVGPWTMCWSSTVYGITLPLRLLAQFVRALRSILLWVACNVSGRSEDEVTTFLFSWVVGTRPETFALPPSAAASEAAAPQSVLTAERHRAAQGVHASERASAEERAGWHSVGGLQSRWPSLLHLAQNGRGGVHSRTSRNDLRNIPAPTAPLSVPLLSDPSPVPTEQTMRIPEASFRYTIYDGVHGTHDCRRQLNLHKITGPHPER